MNKSLKIAVTILFFFFFLICVEVGLFILLFLFSPGLGDFVGLVVSLTGVLGVGIVIFKGWAWKLSVQIAKKLFNFLEDSTRELL